MGIVVIGAVFVDIKGFPLDAYIPTGRNAGHIKYIHGGVSRNVVEDIANIELRPTFLSIVDDSALGEDVIRKLQRHKVNTEYVQKIPEGMGTWLAVFDNDGDLAGSISQRPNLMPILDLINEKGDEIFKYCDSIVLEADIDPEIIKAVLDYSKKYNKKVFGVISNMTLAVERRDLLQQFDCLVCNELEAGIFFAENYSKKSPKDLCKIIYQKVSAGAIKSMVVTMGSKGSIYADHLGNKGICLAKKVTVRDTTGAGDAFCAGLTIGLTYGKELSDAVEIGTKLAASVITSSENVCPRFLPRELGLDMDVSDC
ncbi:carbohydrate kinase family protein [Faecalibacillus intestinalis]|uniref:Carbohydrate kinase family protein n=1 Tax=Faecalibacillus intestinalis TaxID=1982626 RepID=A0AAP2XMJ9_9FIRM|nr:carbohydrate kinase family protein [Faecalibacillus intestinalis]MCB8591370.1 carbohydrate kinase family protein [Faecalibacillus intestinalis]MCB8611786.1 carbohydrate kinase family protein [Faecalibacillus intestinalis]MCG4679904.1 carbohydrate kinase family protein [Faecalibacillus intestinalis]MCG4712833.1 carbohydrate kinase family protein [Faecalibacillus intestinalis]MCG4754047.1 carbohydrate kinase family protein [Faecalibacillus intestinalis]